MENSILEPEQTDWSSICCNCLSNRLSSDSKASIEDMVKMEVQSSIVREGWLPLIRGILTMDGAGDGISDGGWEGDRGGARARLFRGLLSCENSSLVLFRLRSSFECPVITGFGTAGFLNSILELLAAAA